MRRRTTTLLIVGLLLGLLVVAPTATPFRVESATSDAMAPAIESGDAYVTVPADAVSRGDVVVFWAPGEGRFLTRAVIGVEEGGYVLGTGADATPAANGSAPNVSAGDPRLVPRSAIVATVLTLGGSPVVLPGLGRLVSTLAAYRIVGLFLALLVIAFWAMGRRLATRTGGRTATIRLRTVAVPLFAVLFVACVAITPLSATSYQLTYDATGTDGAASGDGENLTREVSLPVATPPLTRWVVDGEGTVVLNWTETRGGLNATLSVPPPAAAGESVVAVHLFPYPAWVPTAPLNAAHGVHPVVASLLGAAMLVGPIAVPYWLFVDGSRPIARVRRRRLYPFR